MPSSVAHRAEQPTPEAIFYDALRDLRPPQTLSVASIILVRHAHAKIAGDSDSPSEAIVLMKTACIWFWIEGCSYARRVSNTPANESVNMWHKQPSEHEEKINAGNVRIKVKLMGITLSGTTRRKTHKPFQKLSWKLSFLLHVFLVAWTDLDPTWDR